MQGQVQLRSRVGAITHARSGFLCLQMKRPGTRVQAERMGVQVGDICTAIAGRLNGLGRSANVLNGTHHVDTNNARHIVSHCLHVLCHGYRCGVVGVPDGYSARKETGPSSYCARPCPEPIRKPVLFSFAPACQVAHTSYSCDCRTWNPCPSPFYAMIGGLIAMLWTDAAIQLRELFFRKIVSMRSSVC